jgi:hypothetical protein
VAQDLAHFFFHRAAVLGRAQAQLVLQVVVESADQEGWHVAIDDSMDIIDIKDIDGINACPGWRDNETNRLKCKRASISGVSQG